MQPRLKVGILILQAKGWYRYPLPWFPLSDNPSRYSCRTTRGCRPYRSSLSGCRFGRSGSSWFVGGFHRLRLSNRGLAPRGRSCRIVGVGNDSMVFAVVEHPFFAEVVADLEHFAVGRGDLVEVVLTQFRF